MEVKVMKKVLTIGGISLVLLMILGMGVFANDNNVDCINYHHDHHGYKCTNHTNDNANFNHHEYGHHNHSGHNCR